MNTLRNWLLIGFGTLLAYLLFWPVPIEPKAWQAPEASLFDGPLPAYELGIATLTPLKGDHGGEDVVVSPDGLRLTGTESGQLYRGSEYGQMEPWVHTGGRPLGLAFDNEGRLVVADANLGLLRVDEGGAVEVLTTTAGGVELGFTNNVAVARDGKIYFTDASSKFRARDFDSPYDASLLDLMEHGGHGRLLVFDPADRSTQVLASGLQFANGVALSLDERFALVNETGAYRVVSVGIEGESKGTIRVLIDNLPGFPDNLTQGRDGRYWLGLVAPRNGLLDSLSDWPFLRRMVQRLPAAIRPKATPYSRLIAIDEEGEVLCDLQDRASLLPSITAGFETHEKLHIASLLAPDIGTLPLEKLSRECGGHAAP